MSLETKAFGLRPRRTDATAGIQPARRHLVAAAYATALYAGDPVKLNAGYAEKATATDSGVLEGVIAQVAYIDTNTGRPIYGKVLPASTTSAGTLEGSTTAFIDVIPSTLGEFEILATSAGSLTQADVGKFFALTLGSADTTLNLSGVSLDASSGASSQTNKVVQLMGLVQEVNNNWGDSTIKVRVRFMRTPINQ